MPDLAQALDAALKAHYPVAEVRRPVSHRQGLTARMNALEKAHTRPGDRKGAATKRAAEAAGVSPRTWQKWRAGTQKPSARLGAKLQKAYQKLITRPKLRKKVNATGAPDRVIVTAEVYWNGYPNRTPQRTVRLAGMRSAMVATIRAWANEGPAAAAAAFQAGAAAAHNVPTIEFAGDDVHVEFP